MLDTNHAQHCAFQQDIDVALARTQSAEILDDIVTRSRGEIKRLNSPKITSSGGTPVAELKGIRSPCISERAYSPCITELRHDRSPLGGRGSPRTGETRSSKLGEGSTPKWSKNDALLIWAMQLPEISYTNDFCITMAYGYMMSYDQVSSMSLWECLCISLA